MALKLLSDKNFHTLHIALFLCFVLCSAKLNAQSVLLPGDVVIVSANADTQSIDFIPLIDIDAGTEIYFSGGVWDDSTQSMSGSELSVTFLSDLEAGTNLHVNAQEDELFEVSGQLNFEGNTHRLFAYQKEDGYYRHIFALGWGAEEVWNETAQDSASSDIPRTIQREELFLTLGAEMNHQYFIRNGASGTRNLLLKFVKDEVNWRSSGEPFPRFGTSFNLLKPPVVLFERSISTVEEADSIAILDVAIYEHDGSRLTADVVFDSTQSIIDHEDINGFTTQTLNFTGLIGDAVYEVRVPIKEDVEFEGRETGIFTLQNLTDGNFGDFLTHSLVINDNEDPEVRIVGITNKQGAKAQIELRNEEGGVISLKGWKLKSGTSTYTFLDGAVLNPDKSLVITDTDLQKQLGEMDPFGTLLIDDLNESLLKSNGGVLELVDPQGNIVDKQRYDPGEPGDKSSSQKVDINNDNVAPENTTKQVNSVAQQVATLPERTTLEKSEASGWKAIQFDQSIMDQFPEKEWIMWDDEEHRFRFISERNDANTENRILFGYFEPAEAETLNANIQLKRSLKDVEQQTVTFNISATDANDNGRIGPLEGLNLLWNPLSEGLRADRFLEVVRSAYPDVAIQSTLFGFQREASGELSIVPFAETDSIAPQSPFWIIIESEQEATSLVLQKEMLLQDVELKQEQVRESVDLSGVTIQLSNSDKTLSESITLHVVEAPSNAQHVLDLESYPDLRLNDQAYFQAAIHPLDAFYSTFSVSSEIASSVALPLYFDTNERESVEFSISEWQQIPEGWEIKLEDQRLDKEYVLREGFTLNFDHEGNLDYSTESDNSTHTTRSSRFIIHFIPSGAEQANTEEPVDAPRELELHQNYPNPFNPLTTISFFLPEPREVKLSVFNIVGQPIAVIVEGTLSAGEQTFEWDARERPSGMYIYQLEVGDKVMTRKMTLVK